MTSEDKNESIIGTTGERVGIPLDNLPDTDRNGKATFSVTLEKQPSTTRPLEAQLLVRLAEPGGRAVERKLTIPVTPSSAMIGVRPAFSGRTPPGSGKLS